MSLPDAPLDPGDAPPPRVSTENAGASPVAAETAPRASLSDPRSAPAAPVAPAPALGQPRGLQADEGFNAALRVWQEINLTKLRAQLDTQGLEVVENQKENLGSRKKLAELTKEWRKGSEEEKKEGWMGLLKAYQNEIDAITKRSKSAEMHFLNLYRLLADAPDPGTLIKSVLDQSSSLTDSETLQMENSRLRTDLEASTKELATLRAQSGEHAQTAAKLARLEQQMEQIIAERVEIRERELRLELEEKTALFKEREHALNRQLQQHLSALATLQSTHDVAQRRLVEGDEERYGREVEGRWREVEMLQGEVERERATRGEVERENELLRQKLERATAAPDPNSLHHLQSLLSASEQESSRLLAELDRAKSQLSIFKATSEAREEELEDKVTTLSEQVEELKKRAGGDEELEKLREEVQVLRSVEFGAETAEQGEDPLSPSSLMIPLDKLLMRKNKRLTTEITEKTVQAAELQSKVTKLEGQVVDLARREAEKDRLIKRLEDDLLRADPIRGSGGPGSLGMAIGPRSIGSSVGLPSAGLLSAVPPQSAVPQSPTTAGPPGTGSPGQAAGASDQQASLIRILTAQRDRYRHRNGELEELHRKDLEQLSEYRTALEGLKEDNLKLYEKVRFLQSAGTLGAASHAGGAEEWEDIGEPGDVETGRGAGQNGGSNSDAKGQRSGNDGARKPFKSAVSSTSASPSRAPAAAAARSYPSVESKYAPMYEARLDPFSRFSRNEEMRRERQLPPLDRATLQFTKFFLANRYTRMTFLVYALVLHFLVTALVYRWSMIEECQHDHDRDFCLAILGMDKGTGGGLKMESGKKFEIEDHGPGFVPEAGHSHPAPKLVRRWGLAGMDALPRLRA